jgi:TPR repeat protein
LFNLGLCYQNGYGAQIDHFKALELYQEEVKFIFSWAMCNIGLMYLNGL